jgi:hypothetical protein
VLGEDELAVPEDVELAFASGRRACVDPTLSKHGHETRGPGLVAVSGWAVEDLDGHVESLTGGVEAGPLGWSRGGSTRSGAILGDVDEEDLRKLEAAGSELSFGAGQMLIERGKPGTGVYVVLEGRIVVEAPEGTRELGPGAVVGERALLSEDGTRSARVRALTYGKVIAVERAEVDRLCAEDPAFAERLAQVS